jgi:hypothetical protein
VLAIEQDRVDRARRALLERQVVAHLAQLAAHPRRRRVGEEDAAGDGLAIAEPLAHLERIDVRRLGGFLRRHPELDDVQEKLQEVLVLRVAAPAPRTRVRLAVLSASVGVSVTCGRLPGSITLYGFCAGSVSKLCRALAQADARLPSDLRRNPAAARRHRHHPPFLVRGLDRSRAELNISWKCSSAADVRGFAAVAASCGSVSRNGIRVG